MEVDASSCGIGAVLSQRQGALSKLHPCTFYSRKLMTAEANYDVRNKELLSIKAALEEWRHWLEGACHPFLWVHESLSMGHPGVHRSSQLLHCRFWWATLKRDVKNFVKSCPTCTQTRGSHQIPEGLLEPLPVPQQPWSHISTDFLTALPRSWGFTTVMVIVDRFSKACKLVPMKGLPTALQTADALLQDVFRNFGLSEDIVSDRGPQFTSRVWRAFCEQLGSTYV
ncbi:hypothetical protein QTP86_010901 [Hemibagrus guttatus]|nr:hypothetical protein QTP86_010901 [Hemibagrus guttatus]